ncbi:cytochrome C assembly family protein [Carnimonas bestiolae]|uniref:cytochrome C assembly family protein n=1 Tax=Carnimonas bestiolae TaxID=3402172 RepID=UPI003EDC0DFA
MYAVLPCALLAILLYLAGGIWQACVLGRKTDSNPALVRSTGLIASALHAVTLYVIIYKGAGTYNLGILETLSLVCWVMTLLTLLASLASPLIAATAVLLPLSAISLVTLVGLPASLNYNHFPPGVLAHIAGSILAFSLFAIAAAQACLIALQDRALKTKRLRGIVQVLPPLTQMERMLFALITLGMIFLTLAIISGALFVFDSSAEYLTSKALLSILAWLIFGALLWQRQSSGWRGRRAARWTLIGMGVLVLTYISSRLILDTAP